MKTQIFALKLASVALALILTERAGAASWLANNPMSVARQDPTVTLLRNGKALVAGGYSSGAGYTATAELYDPATGFWTGTGSMNTGRYRHTATLLADG